MTISDAGSATPSTESFDLWALRDRYKSVITQFYDVWKTYMQWYTAFLTFNVAALVFYKSLFATTSNPPTQASQTFSHPIVIGVFFIIQDAMAIMTSVMMAEFSRRNCRNLNELLRQIAKLMPEPKTHLNMLIHERKLLPKWLAILGGYFNATGALTLLAAWIVMTFAS